MIDPAQTRVLNFWFRELTPNEWFGAADSLDLIVRNRFEGLHAQAAAGLLDDWAKTPLGRLSLILILDQFSRHIFRGEADAFAFDDQAQKLAVEGLAQGMDEQLTFAHRHFFYMPLMHAENPALQRMSVESFERLKAFADQILQFAQAHQQEVNRFGRFPHRNVALGRLNTDAETKFMSSEPTE